MDSENFSLLNLLDDSEHYYVQPLLHSPSLITTVFWNVIHSARTRRQTPKYLSRLFSLSVCDLVAGMMGDSRGGRVIGILVLGLLMTTGSSDKLLLISGYI